MILILDIISLPPSQPLILSRGCGARLSCLSLARFQNWTRPLKYRELRKSGSSSLFVQEMASSPTDIAKGALAYGGFSSLTNFIRTTINLFKKLVQPVLQKDMPHDRHGRVRYVPSIYCQKGLDTKWVMEKKYRFGSPLAAA